MRGDRLKELRIDKKISQQQLATELGVDRTMIGKYELKNNQPSSELLEKMAKFFNVTPAYLMGFDEQLTDDKIYSPKEIKLIEIFRSLDERGKENMLRNAEGELDFLKRK